MELNSIKLHPLKSDKMLITNSVENRYFRKESRIDFSKNSIEYLNNVSFEGLNKLRCITNKVDKPQLWDKLCLINKRN